MQELFYNKSGLNLSVAIDWHFSFLLSYIYSTEKCDCSSSHANFSYVYFSLSEWIWKARTKTFCSIIYYSSVP